MNPLAKFNIPVLPTSGNLRVNDTIVVDNGIKIPINNIPDYVYNESNSGYGAMFSPSKLGLKTGGTRGTLLLPVE